MDDVVWFVSCLDVLHWQVEDVLVPGPTGKDDLLEEVGAMLSRRLHKEWMKTI